MFRVSLTNYVATATVSLGTPGTEDAAYTAQNVKTPERPGKPWKTTAITDQRIVINFGAPRALDVIGIIAANVVSITLQGDASDSWGGPSWSQVAIIGQNPWNGRYHRAHTPSGTGAPFNYQFLSALITAQAPVDGASVFSLGGIWAGTWTYAERDIHWEYPPRTRWPRHREEPEHRGWSEDSLMGMPIALVRMRRQALLRTLPIGANNDQVAQWQGLDRAMFRAPCFLVDLAGTPTAPEQCLIMKREDDEPEWTSPDAFHPENAFDLKEVVG